MSVDVSVIIPVKNGEQWLGDQLAALAAQDFAGTWEVVVADNGSTDGTSQMVQTFSGSAPMPVRWVDASDRAGASHARNSGAVASRGRVLAFCDCDDRVSPGWVSAAVRALPRAEFVAGLNRELTEPQDTDSTILNPGAVMRGTRINAFVSCNVAVRRSAYFSVGGFDESLPPYGCEDIELAVRAHQAGMSVAGDEDMLVYFRRTTGLRTTVRKIFLSAKAETVLWHRHRAHFADRIGLGRAFRELLAAPLVVVRLAAHGFRPKSVLRDLLTRVGHLVAEIELARGKYPGAAILLAPEDDVLAKEG